MAKNSAWRANNYPKKQRDYDWNQYLRRQADLPIQAGLPYGNRRRRRAQPPTQGARVYENGDDDAGISKIDFTSPPVTLTWLDLRAEAPPKDKGLKRSITKAFCRGKEVSEPKVLLKGGKLRQRSSIVSCDNSMDLVSGIAKPGQLVAIMGASGAGKTTLMNVLTNRRPGALKVSGEVRVNGTKMGRNINRVAGYVQQEELFIPSMTTREHLFFHVSMKDRSRSVDVNHLAFCRPC